MCGQEKIQTYGKKIHEKRNKNAKREGNAYGSKITGGME